MCGVVSVLTVLLLLPTQYTTGEIVKMWCQEFDIHLLANIYTYIYRYHPLDKRYGFSISVQPEITSLLKVFFPMLKKKSLFFQKLAGLWLVCEVVNHVGLYGSKVAEVCSAFQRRSCYVIQSFCFNSRLMTSIWPAFVAAINGVHPRLEVAFMSLPLSSNNSTSFVWPCLAAQYNGVQPSSSLISMLALCLSNNSAIYYWLLLAAKCNAVHPLPLFMSIWALCFNSCLVTSTWPAPVAVINGVLPWLDVAFMSLPLSINSATSFVWPFLAAHTMVSK